MLDFSVTFIITIINIVILFLILRKLLFKPVTKFIEGRAKRVQDSIDQAEKDKNEAEKLLFSYETMLKNAKDEADKIIRTARENADMEAKNILLEGKAEADKIILQSRMQMENEKQAIIVKFKTEAAILVMAAASKLAAKEISSEDHKRYANMMLDELTLKVNQQNKKVF